MMLGHAPHNPYNENYRVRTLWPPGARQQPREQDALGDVAPQGVKGSLSVDRVVTQQYCMVRVVPPIRLLRQQLVPRVPSLKAAHILCVRLAHRAEPQRRPI